MQAGMKVSGTFFLDIKEWFLTPCSVRHLFHYPWYLNETFTLAR